MRKILASLLFLTACTGGKFRQAPTDRKIDLSLYAGKWYEVARFDNYFERNLTDIYAVYTIEDESVIVENNGIKPDGSPSSIRGFAYAPDPNVPARLRVSFVYPFYSDYIILEIDKKYRWALVGGSSMEYLWILSRTPSLPQSIMEHILGLAKRRGYDIEKLTYTLHNGGRQQ